MDEKDCTVTFSGTNGKGKANVACMMDQGNYNDFFTTVKYTVKPNENLKNGQTVYVEARYDEESARHYRIHPVNTSFKTEVEGLEQRQKDWKNRWKNQFKKIQHYSFQIWNPSNK